VPVFYTLADDLTEAARRLKSRILGRTGVAAAD
jgi:hypothetical protein